MDAQLPVGPPTPAQRREGPEQSVTEPRLPAPHSAIIGKESLNTLLLRAGNMRQETNKDGRDLTNAVIFVVELSVSVDQSLSSVLSVFVSCALGLCGQLHLRFLSPYNFWL